MHNGVIISKILINDKEIDNNGNFVSNRSVLNIKLNDAILPKSNADIYLEWQFTIPKKSNVRMGTYDSASFFVAYFYPSIAVYDDIDGWDNVGLVGCKSFTMNLALIMYR